MYHLMQSNFGQLDRKTFKKELIKCTTTQDMRPIRHSLFDLVRQRETVGNVTKQLGAQIQHLFPQYIHIKIKV
jgi:hypothetical protein